MTTWQGVRGIVGTMIAASLGLAQPAVACEPQWVHQLGAADVAEASAVAVGDQGSVYVAGSITGPLDGSGASTNDDAWIAKYSAAGAPLWKRRLGSAALDSAAGVTSDRKDAVYMAGSTQGSLGGRFQGGIDAWVAKYSAGGDLRWKQQLGSSGLDVAWGAAADGDGNVYIAGWTSGSLGAQFQGGESDAWVAKYSPAGVLLWLQQPGTTDSERAEAVSTDRSGNVFIAGSTVSSTSADGGDAWVAKYSAAGRLLWKHTLGTPVLDSAQGVAAADDGSVYVAGNTFGKIGGQRRGDFDAWVEILRRRNAAVEAAARHRKDRWSECRSHRWPRQCLPLRQHRRGAGRSQPGLRRRLDCQVWARWLVALEAPAWIFRRGQCSRGGDRRRGQRLPRRHDDGLARRTGPGDHRRLGGEVQHEPLTSPLPASAGGFVTAAPGRRR
ncbi:MAG: SBBP repeat-containing protein [Rhodospirillales bacterium]